MLVVCAQPQRLLCDAVINAKHLVVSIGVRNVTDLFLFECISELTNYLDLIEMTVTVYIQLSLATLHVP